MAIQKRIFQQFHYSSSADVMGAGNTHGWGIVSSSRADDEKINEEITNIMVSEYPIVKGKETTEYMVYVPKYQTFITIGLSNTDSIKNGRDSRFAHIFMLETKAQEQFFNEHPENFIPELFWEYEKDIQNTKYLASKTCEVLSLNLVKLIHEVGFRTQGELAYFIKQVYSSLFKSAQTLYICNADGSNFREIAKKMSVLLLYLIPPKFYIGKSFAFFADSDIKSTSFVFRNFSDSLNQWTIGQHKELRGEGYEDAFYLDMAKRLLTMDSKKSFLQLREYLNKHLVSEDYHSIFPIYYEMLLKEGKNIHVENWKPQYIDGILYDVAEGKYWELSVYLMNHLKSDAYPARKVESWYKKWMEVADIRKDYTAIEKVKVKSPLSKEETHTFVKTEIKRPKNDNRSLEEIEDEVDKILKLMPSLTSDAQMILIDDFVSIYRRIVKNQGNVKTMNRYLCDRFEIVRMNNDDISNLILETIRKNFQQYVDTETFLKMICIHNKMVMPQFLGKPKQEEVKEEKILEVASPPKTRKSKAPLIVALVALLAAGGVCAAFAVKSMTKEVPVVPSTTPSITTTMPTTATSTEETTKPKKEKKKNVDTTKADR